MQAGAVGSIACQSFSKLQLLDETAAAHIGFDDLFLTVDFMMGGAVC